MSAVHEDDELWARRAAELAELTSDRDLEPGEYSATQQQLVLLGAMVSRLNLGAFLRQIDRTETTAPLLDPTLYMRAAGKLERVKDLARAAQVFRCEFLRQARLELDERKRKAGAR